MRHVISAFGNVGVPEAATARLNEAHCEGLADVVWGACAIPCLYCKTQSLDHLFHLAMLLGRGLFFYLAGRNEARCKGLVDAVQGAHPSFSFTSMYTVSRASFT